MRITIVQDYLRNGGTERQSVFLAKRIQKAGHFVQLVLFRPSGRLISQLEEAGIPYSSLQSRDTFISFYAPRLIKTLKSTKADIVLCMGRTANCYSGYIQKKLKDSLVVGTLRTGKAIFPLHHWSLPHVSAVLVNTNWWKRRMLEKGFDDDHVHVIHNPLHLDADRSDIISRRKAVRKRMHLKGKQCVFINVATFRPGKKHLKLIKLFEEQKRREPEKKWQLWLVGDGKEQAKCMRYVRKKGLTNRIKFLGYETDPFDYYCAADIAVSASMEDSLPNFLIEAQVMGLPLIAYDCRGVVECCIPGESGLVLPAQHEESFLWAINLLLENKNERKKLSAAAPEFARNKFCPEKQAAETLVFLEKLLKHSGLS